MSTIDRCSQCYGVGVAVSVIDRELYRERCTTCAGVGLVVHESKGTRPFTRHDIPKVPAAKRNAVRAGWEQRYGVE